MALGKHCRPWKSRGENSTVVRLVGWTNLQVINKVRISRIHGDLAFRLRLNVGFMNGNDNGNESKKKRQTMKRGKKFVQRRKKNTLALLQIVCVHNNKRVKGCLQQREFRP
jgi:hypothetical protein